MGTALGAPAPLFDPTTPVARMSLRLFHLGLVALGAGVGWWNIGLETLAWVATVAVPLYALALFRLPYWSTFAIDFALFVPLLRASGGTTSPFLPFPYVWLLGVALMNHRMSRRSPMILLGLSVLLAMAVSTLGNEGWLRFITTQAIVMTVAVALLLALLRERNMNLVDPLCHVLHRRAGIDQLEGWVREDRLFSLAFLDCKGFKGINDRYGHGVGDEVLHAVASRISSAVRREDIVMRYGGDEFVVASSSPELGQRLENALASPIRTSVGEVELRVDVGQIKRLPGEGVEDILASADAAMYRRKRDTMF